ncbi:MAG: hypothetical protein ACJ749_13010 [Flavisolibacter sp.]
MESESTLKEHILQKLRELDQQVDMQDVMWKSRISFGMDARKYGHLPAFKELVRKKKKLVRSTWIYAYILSLIIVFCSEDVMHNFSVNWWKTIVSWLILSAVVMVIFLVHYNFIIFAQVRDTETEVRKIIYQDMLDQIQ